MYSGRAGDALSGGSGMVDQWSASNNGMQFSTRDQDNDRFLQGSCATENMGGWWYNRYSTSTVLQHHEVIKYKLHWLLIQNHLRMCRCHVANLNGRYYRGGKYTAKHDNGVVWGPWRGLWYSIRHTSMKVRPMAFLDSLGSGAGTDD